jgi:hypothetical protein
MSAHLRERINRRLDALTDERLYQVLDYVEFLESKYAERQAVQPNALQRFAEGVEDTLRAGRVSTVAISETMGLLNRAVGVLNGVAAAGKSVATDIAAAASRVSTTPAQTDPITTPVPVQPPAPSSAPSSAPPAATERPVPPVTPPRENQP